MAECLRHALKREHYRKRLERLRKTLKELLKKTEVKKKAKKILKIEATLIGERRDLASPGKSSPR